MEFNDSLTVGMMKDALKNLPDDTKVFAFWSNSNVGIGIKQLQYRDNPAFMSQLSVVIEELEPIQADGFTLMKDSDIN
ncbi:hypothetical protein B795N_00540 [Marinilactibacillus psychrotolerans]|uniref:hypothetical protein n=1 Tax=Marinilactibacillus psychrotolerans TaxID=191770 RepID=UPI001C7D8ED6|nr:hypothetical protein [Marinilactibacillus psychrotolerans]GEQ32172.1 hypothetical protein B795N_00540 [Marinilactibacillus psychrotolerans]